MAYQFSKKPVAGFKFLTNSGGTDTTTLAGINASLSSADTICDGIASLMAIGGNYPDFDQAVRTSQETVNEE